MQTLLGALVPCLEIPPGMFQAMQVGKVEDSSNGDDATWEEPDNLSE